jgi:hypothetical protein
VSEPRHTKDAVRMERNVCTHEHDCGNEDFGGSSLHGHINHQRVTVLNAEDDAAAPRVLRPWYLARTRHRISLWSRKKVKV